MYDGDSVWTLEVDLAGPVHQAARHEGGAVIQVPVLPDGVDTGLERKKIMYNQCNIFLLIWQNDFVSFL